MFEGETNNLSRQGTQDRNPRPSRRRVATPFRAGPPPPLGTEAGPFFYAGLHKVTKSMAGRLAPPLSTVRACARWRLAVLRTMHRRLIGIGRFAPSPYAGAEAPRHGAKPSPIATSLFASRKPPRRTAVLRTPLRCFANPYAPSFGSERITAFFRHHGPGGLGNLPSRQHALGPETSADCAP